MDVEKFLHTIDGISTWVGKAASWLIMALMTVVCEAGSHVVLPGDLYGGTYRLVDKVLRRWGLSYDLVDQSDLEALSAAIREETRLIWVESPTNPLFKEIVESQLAFAQRAVQWEQDYVVSRRMAYEHYWGPNAKKPI